MYNGDLISDLLEVSKEVQIQLQTFILATATDKNVVKNQEL